MLKNLIYISIFLLLLFSVEYPIFHSVYRKDWMLYCTHQIRLKGADDADELFNDVVGGGRGGERFSMRGGPGW